ncbi:hypothetical protein KR044_006357 [Drosophila immigrans]|nr:hypothetical protein KR044_006357 [Drosophila immigrans]
MADEEDPWGFDDGGDASDAKSSQPGTADVALSKAESVKSEARSEAALAEAAGEPEQENIVEPEVEVKAPPPPPEDDGYRKPVQLYRHWVRPKFLQYKYMYNYRTNYYDDVIDYLDKKQVGVSREIPRPQTWAERVLRTRDINGSDLDSFVPMKRDKHLIQTLAASIRTYNYHTKAYINQRYANVL